MLTPSTAFDSGRALASSVTARTYSTCENKSGVLPRNVLVLGSACSAISPSGPEIVSTREMMASASRVRPSFAYAVASRNVQGRNAPSASPGLPTSANKTMATFNAVIAPSDRPQISALLRLLRWRTFLNYQSVITVFLRPDDYLGIAFRGGLQFLPWQRAAETEVLPAELVQ